MVITSTIATRSQSTTTPTVSFAWVGNAYMKCTSLGHDPMQKPAFAVDVLQPFEYDYNNVGARRALTPVPLRARRRCLLR